MAAMLGQAQNPASSPVAQPEVAQTEGLGRVLEESLEHLAAARRTGDPVTLRRCESVVVDRYRPVADRIARRYRGRGM